MYVCMYTKNYNYTKIYMQIQIFHKAYVYGYIIIYIHISVCVCVCVCGVLPVWALDCWRAQASGASSPRTNIAWDVWVSGA